MKKFLLIINCSLFVFHCSLANLFAEKLCVVAGGAWNSAFTAATPGWIHGATESYVTGMGNTAATDPTWRFKHTKNSITTVISGIHKCSSQSWFGDGAPNNNDGQYCHCQRTLVNGTPNAGVWILRNFDTSGNCDASCAKNCSGYSITYPGLRSAMLAVSLP